MPQLKGWDSLPEGIRQHLIERMRDRAISISDLNQLRQWVETRPEVPDGDWCKGKLQRVRPCDQSASANSSSVVAQRLSIPRLTGLERFMVEIHRRPLPRHGTDRDSKPLPSFPGICLPARPLQCRQ